MSLFKRGHNVLVSYDPDTTSKEDLAELREDLAETFREMPETYGGRDKLTIVTTNMIDDDGRLIRRKAKRAVRKGKRTVRKEEKKETSAQELARLKSDIWELEERLEREKETK